MKDISVPRQKITFQLNIEKNIESEREREREKQEREFFVLFYPLKHIYTNVTVANFFSVKMLHYVQIYLINLQQNVHIFFNEQNIPEHMTYKYVSFFYIANG